MGGKRVRGGEGGGAGKGEERVKGVEGGKRKGEGKFENVGALLWCWKDNGLSGEKSLSQTSLSLSVSL